MKNKILQLKKEVSKKEEEIKKIAQEISPLQTTMSRLYAEREKLQEELNDTIIKNTKRPDWEWILHEEGPQGQVRYKYAQKQLANLGLRASGYYPDTKQRAIQISLIKGDPNSLKSIKKGLKIILPYVKELKTGDLARYKVISIFEHTLSEDGCYTLIFRGKEIKLHRIRYHHPEVLNSFPNIDEALKYIQDVHYYEVKINE